MAIAVKHKFTSVKGDGSDATLVRPSNWNDSHDVTLASQTIMGRMAVGNGPVEEIPTTSYMAGLLNTADKAALAALLGLPTTGDAKLTFKLVADAGWIMANDGTIGDGFSNATTASSDCLALFTMFYNNFPDAVTPVQTATGVATTRAAQGSATLAWGNHCRMVLPKQLGRALIIAGSGAGLTPRNLGAIGGEELHALSANESVTHTHATTGSATISGTLSGTFSGSGSTVAVGVSVSGGCSGTTDGESVDHAHYTSGRTGYEGGVDHLHGLGGHTGGVDRDLNHLHGIGGSTGSADRDLNHTHSGSSSHIGYSTGVGGSYAYYMHDATGFFGDANMQNTGYMDRSIDHLHGLPAQTGFMDRGIDHLHGLPAQTGAADRGLNHDHSWGNWSGGRNVGHTHTFGGSSSGSGTVPATSVSVSGSVSIPNSSVSGLTISLPSTNAPAGFNGAAHNNMQPFTAWNIMIRL